MIWLAFILCVAMTIALGVLCIAFADDHRDDKIAVVIGFFGLGIVLITPILSTGLVVYKILEM